MPQNDALGFDPDAIIASLSGSRQTGGVTADALMASLTHQESRGRQFGQDGKPITSPRGAIGIAQVMPSTAPEAARLAGIAFDEDRYRNDADYNRELGRAYLDKQLQDFKDPALALAAYNAGPGAVRKALAKAEAAGNPQAWLQHLPRETQDYVPSVMSKAGVAGGAKPAPAPRDYYAAPTEGTYSDAQALPERTMGEAAADTALGLASGVAGLIGTAGDLYGLATGNTDNAVKRAGDAAQEYLQSKQSAQLQQKRQDRSDAIDAEDSILGKAWTAFSTTLSDPALLGDVASSNVATLIPAGLVGRLTATFIGGRAMLAAMEAGPISLATRHAIAKSAATLGVAAGVGAGAVQQGADVAGEVYDDSMKKSQAQWDANPEYRRRIEAGESDAKVKHELALAAARDAFTPAAAISVVANALPGGTTIERALIGGAARGTFKAGTKAAAVKGVIKGGAGETTTEFNEEGGGKYVGNRAKQRYVDPNQDPWEGVGESAGLGAAGGLALGGPAGAFHGSSHEPAPAAPAAPVNPALAPAAAKAAEPNSPLSKAAVAGNAGLQAAAAAAPPPAADPIAATVSTAQERVREGGLLDVLRRDDAPVDPKVFLNDLAVASSPATPAHLREQAAARIDVALGWAERQERVAAAPQPGLDQLAGIDADQAPAARGAAPTRTQLQQGADRDARLQRQAQDATTEFDRQLAREQAATNRERRMRAPEADTRTAEELYRDAGRLDAQADQLASDPNATAATLDRVQQLRRQAEDLRRRRANAPATRPAATPAANPNDQARLEAAALAGKDAQRRAEDGPRQAVIDRAMHSIEERGGVASPAEARILAEAGMGRPYDRIDETLAPALSPDEQLTQATGIALGRAPRSSVTQGAAEAEAAGQAAEQRAREDSAQDTLARQRTERRAAADAQAAAHAAPRATEAPAAADVVEALKTIPALRTAEQRATVEGARRGYSSEQMRLLQDAATNPANLSATDHLALDQLGVKRSADREGGIVAPAIEETVSGGTVSASRVATPAGQGPAIIRRRRAQLDQLAQMGFTVVERDASGWVMRNPKTSQVFKLDGAVDAQLARAAVKAAIDAKAHEAAASPKNDLAEPTQAQIEATNYKKGRIENLHGFRIAIENPAGSVRRGVSPDGTPWESELAHHYGEFERTEGADGDPVDVFIGPRPDSTKIFVVDQRNADGSFDEHKVMMGFTSEEAARAGYLANYKPGWDGLQAITEMTPEQLRAWLKSDTSKRPAAESVAGTVTFTDKGRPVTLGLVAESALDEKKRAQLGVLKQLAALFGKKVAIFTDPKSEIKSDGFVIPSDQDTLYLNEKSGISALSVFGHELTHQLKAENPEAYAAMADVVRERLRNKKGFAEFYGDSKLSDEQLLEELVSDLMGDLFADQSFWAEVFAKIEKDNGTEARGIIARLAAFVYRLLDEATAAFKGERTFGSKRFIDDSKEVRAAFRDALAAYAKQRGVTRTAMQADVLRASQEAKKSPARRGAIGDTGAREDARTPADAARVGAADRPVHASRGAAGALADQARGGDGAAPRYGSPREGAVSAVGVHYSREPRRNLSAAYYGRGLKGAERHRLEGAENADIRPRIHFYVDKGQGVRPEAGVGGHAHAVQLDNLYDVQKDELGLVRENPGANNWERAITKAGFDGYLSLDPLLSQGFAVLVGPKHTAVPVAPTEAPRAAAPAAAEPETVKRGLMSAELKAIDLAAIPGAKIASGTLTIPALQREAANAEMERIGSPVRFSRERLDAPAEQYAAIERKYRGTEQWMKAPNGKPTNLLEWQWVQVRTPAFKEWFGDWEAYVDREGGVWNDSDGKVSKAVDANGEPLVLYHGTSYGGFSEFRGARSKTERGQLGIFLTSDRDMAQSYVRKGRGADITEKDIRDEYDFWDSKPGVYSLFANIRNPHEDFFEGANWDGGRQGQFQVVNEEGETLHNDQGRAYFADESEAQALAEQNGAEVRPAEDHRATTDDVVREAHRGDNDGAIVREVVDDGGGSSIYLGDPADVFVAFSPEQVKSADFNNGTYLASERDIRRSARRVDFTDPAARVEVSTTVPTAKKGGMPLHSAVDEKWIIDASDVKGAKKHAEAAEAAIRTYNAVRVEKKADAFKALHDVVVDNLIWLYEKMPPALRERAKLWYEGANRIANELGARHELDPRKVSGVLAVLSPQKDWFMNTTLGERVIVIHERHAGEPWSEAMTAWTRSYVAASKTSDEKAARTKLLHDAVRLEGTRLADMEPADAARFIRVFDETYFPRSYRVVTPEGGFGDLVSTAAPDVELEEGAAPGDVAWGAFATIQKGVEILRASPADTFRTISEALGGEHKVRNFYNNIIAPGSEDGHVTIDTHAVAAAFVKALSGTSLEVNHNFGTSPKGVPGAGQNTASGASGLYGLFADAYREAAAKVGVLPREMQSITWEAIRSIFTPRFKSSRAGEVEAIFDRYAAGEITREEARRQAYELAGGIKSMPWEATPEGRFVAEGGSSFDSTIQADPAERKARLLEPADTKDKIRVSLSAATDSIGGISELLRMAGRGDMLAHQLLQDIAADALAHLLGGTSAKLKVDRATGLYGGSAEPALGITVTFTDSDRAKVLAALAKFAENFNQEQVHVRSAIKARAGTDFGDGSYATISYRFALDKALSRRKIQSIIDKSGLAGLTFGDDFVEAYFVGDPSNDAAIEEFRAGAGRVRDALGAHGQAAQQGVDRLWVYGHGEGAIGFERIRGDVSSAPSLSGQTAKRVAQYLNAVDDKPGKVRAFEQADITPEQAELQRGIAAVYEQLPDNDLKNPRVRRAYAELAKEVKRQFRALPVKVEILAGQGEPYRNSAEMRRDVLDNNHLFIFATTPETFGPEGVDFSGHPLLEDSGLKDAKGHPLLMNDLLRAVHDYFAHTLSPVQFGPKGEEAAWKNHMAMTANPWARWALTSETRGQNSWVNFREDLDPATPVKDRPFARQKAALLPVEYSMTGDAAVDRPMKAFAKGLPEAQRVGSKPAQAEIRKSTERRAIVANALGAASNDPDHAKAKAGDVPAAVRLAKKLVTPELIERLRGIEQPLVAGVTSIESTGKNALPLAAAEVIGQQLGADVDNEIVQANAPKRTAMDGLARLFARPEFDGAVEAGRNYVLVDDTITQGGTLASLANHIEAGGGKVAAIVALTGKQYSARIDLSRETLHELRSKHGPIEDQFRAATGRGFGDLTESEARYLVHFKPADALRDRIVAAAREAAQQGDPGDAQTGLKKSAERVWYSQLQRAIEQVPERLSTMAAPQWAQWLKANAAKLGVKADEITWSGIEDYLKLRGKDKVSAEELAAWVGQNGVQVTETVLGGEDLSGLSASERQELAELRDLRRRASEGEDGVIDDGELDRLDELEFRVGDSDQPASAKYQQYTLPGGENYREVLLTLPFSTGQSTEQIQADIDRLGAITREHMEAQRRGDRTAIQALEAEKAQIVARQRAREEAWSKSYRSSHWTDTPNVLAHIRVNDRTDADGKRVLFVEELQSDWGQEGKKKGFSQAPLPPEEMARMTVELAGLKERRRALVAADRASGIEQVSPETERVLDAEAALQSRISAAKRAASEGVPRAPFVGKTDAWLSLALKRVIKMAVDEGYDRVAFVNGEQSAERYDLSKQVDEIHWSRTDGKYDLLARKRGDGVSQKIANSVPEDGLADYVGKEVAQKIIDAKGKKWQGTLSGLDLKVGGEGMKAFYDTIVPNAAKSLVKKLGGDGLTTIDIGSPVRGSAVDGRTVVEADITREEFDRDWGDGYTFAVTDSRGHSPQTAFDITPKMREQAEGGMALFSRSREDQTAEQPKITSGDRWSVYTMKKAVFKGGALIRWVEDRDSAYIIDIQSQREMSGRKLVQWLTDHTGHTPDAVGVVEDAQGFWDKMEEEGLIGMQTDENFMDFFGRSTTKYSRNRNPQTETPAFKAWFGESKVVDADGAPLVVYTGTSKDVDFKSFKVPANGAWFTADAKSASDYALENDSKGLEYNPDTRRYDEKNTASRVIPAYLRIEKPYTLTDKETERLRLASNYKREQGIVFNTVRARGFDGIDFGDGIWVVLKQPEQIKSAVGNDGGFDPGKKDITKSAERGNTQVLETPNLTIESGTTGSATEGWQTPSASKFDDMVYKLQDKQVDTKRVVDAVRESGKEIADDLDVYLREELFHGRAAKRTEDFVQMELEPLIEEMRKAGIKIEELDEFLHARHAREANAIIAKRNPEIQDGGSGMLNQDAEAYFAELPADRRKALEAAAAKVDGILKKTRQLMVDYELESQKKIDGWAEMFEHYVPLMREDDGGHAGGSGAGQGFSIKGKEVKSRTGSTRKVVDILANIAMQRERTIVRGEKNRVSRALFGLAAANPNEAFWTVDTHVPTEKVYNEKTGQVEDRPDNLYKQRDNVLVTKIADVNGDVSERAVVFNEKNERAMRMAAALKNLDAAQLEGLLGAGARLTRYFSSVNTQYNPVFGVVNLVRDVQEAMLNLSSTELKGKQKEVARQTLSALRGIYGDLRAARKGRNPDSKWAALWDEFQEHGGQTGYRELFATSNDRADAIRKALDPDAWMDGKLGRIFTAGGALKVPLSVAMKGARWIFDWLSDYNEAMENGVRLAAYKTALDAGMSKDRAASLAKNLTVNFNRKGQVTQQAGAMYAFFNASVQGTARVAQTIFDMEPGKPKTIRLSAAGKKIVYGGMMLGSMQALMLAAAGFGEDDPPEFLRETALIIPTGGKTYISIPMPMGLRVIPNIGRITTQWALGGFSRTPQRSADILGIFADAFNPIGNAGLSMQTIAPTALDPFVALTENKDWAGRPIAKESRNKATPGHALARDTATSVGKVISESVNYLSGGTKYTAGVLSPTPDQIDYLLGQITGGVGRELSKADQLTLGTIHGESVPLYKVPLVGRFVGNSASQASEGANFYANTDRLNELETEIKGLRKDGKLAEAQALAAKRPESYLITQANHAESQIQKLRKQKSELIKSGAGRDAVRKIEEKITARMAALNRAVEELKARQ